MQDDLANFRLHITDTKEMFVLPTYKFLECDDLKTHNKITEQYSLRRDDSKSFDDNIDIKTYYSKTNMIDILERYQRAELFELYTNSTRHLLRANLKAKSEITGFPVMTYTNWTNDTIESRLDQYGLKFEDRYGNNLIDVRNVWQYDSSQYKRLNEVDDTWLDKEAEDLEIDEQNALYNDPKNRKRENKFFLYLIHKI